MANPLLPEPEAPRLALRPREAAEALGISARTLWTWTKEGRVPCKRIGRAVLYSTDALRRWLDEQAQATGNATKGGDQ